MSAQTRDYRNGVNKFFTMAIRCGHHLQNSSNSILVKAKKLYFQSDVIEAGGRVWLNTTKFVKQYFRLPGWERDSCLQPRLFRRKC